MVELQFNKRKDKYFITNQEESTISYEVKRFQDCNAFYTIYDGEILAGEEEEITLDRDGEYIVVVTNQELEETTITIKHYLELQLAVIEDVYSVICQCDCGCQDCDDLGTDECNALLIAKAKMEAYKRLMNPQFVSFFDTIYAQTKCLMEQEIYCCINEEKIKGSSLYNENLIKKFIAYDYLAIYFYEYFLACLSDEKEYVINKFKTNKIFCCISKLGIDIKELETLIENNMGTLTFNSAAYVNLPPSQVGDNTLSVSNRASTPITLAMITTQTTPAYADPENDPVQDVRIDTIPTDGTLELSTVAVIAGQIITVADINAGNLIYESPDQDASDSDAITFSLRDTGSGQFSS